GHGRAFWRSHTFTLEAEEAPQRVGAIVDREEASEGKTVLAEPGTAKPGFLKVWFPQQFLRGPYLVRFRVRGNGIGPGPLATFSVVRHFQDRIHDIPTSRPWSGRPAEGTFEEIALPVTVELEPMKLEARVFYHGNGALEIDRISIVPDIRAILSLKLGALREVLAGLGSGATTSAQAP
ncbi:MAG: hypothetical protein ACRELA_19030, partial [Candidatus Rokuibacteriota bacterium]